MNPLCPRCGAAVPVGAPTCPFCGMATAYGHAAAFRAEEEERARRAHAEHARQRTELMARAELDAAAQQSLLWSLGAVVLCCVPGPQIMALVRFAAAKKTAAALGAPVPAKATAGMVLSIVSIVLGVTLVTWSLVRADSLEKKATKRIAELDAITARSDAALLDRGTACALAERYVLANGFGGDRGYSFEAFECVGKLTAAGERAELEDFRFANESSHERSVVSVCMKRGAKWFVAEIVKGRCATEDAPPPAESASARPSATARPSAAPARASASAPATKASAHR